MVDEPRSIETAFYRAPSRPLVSDIVVAAYSRQCTILQFSTVHMANPRVPCDAKKSRNARVCQPQAVLAAEVARAMHETWQMSAADIAGHHRDLFVQFSVACGKSREALAFSWRSVQQMEDRDAEDWTQVRGSLQ